MQREIDVGNKFSEAVGEIHSLFPLLSRKELYQMISDFFKMKADEYE